MIHKHDDYCNNDYNHGGGTSTKTTPTRHHPRPWTLLHHQRPVQRRPSTISWDSMTRKARKTWKMKQAKTRPAAPSETYELGLNEKESEKELEANASKNKRNQAVLGLSARDWVSILLRPRLYDAYTAPRPPSRPRTSQHVQAPTPDASGDFSFWYFPSPPKKGAGWGRGAQRARETR